MTLSPISDKSRGKIRAEPDPFGWFNLWLGVLADYVGVGFIVLFAVLVLAA